MLVHPQPDPVAVALGPLQVHWYGLMYLAAFASAWWLGRQPVRQSWRNWTPEQLDEMAKGSLRKAVVDGDVEDGSVMAGQISGMLETCEPCSAIFDKLETQFFKEFERIAGQMSALRSASVATTPEKEASA